MNLENEDRVAILMQLQEIATDQMAEIKRDEMSWLNRFLLFYGAVTAWLVTRFFAPVPAIGHPASAVVSDASLLGAALWLSLSATVLFVFLFIHTRHSYYDVADRSHRIQNCLHLYEPEQWRGHSLFSTVHRSGRVCTLQEWKERTKPWSSFLTRLLYIIGANLVVNFIVYVAFDRMGKPQGAYFVCFWLALNIALVLIAYALDYLHFRNRDAFER
jgi:hypothetical protein